MIEANGTKLHVDGTLIDLLDEFAGIIAGLHESFVEEYGEDIANRLIATCGQMALCKEEDREKRDEIFAPVIAKLLKDMRCRDERES